MVMLLSRWTPRKSALSPASSTTKPERSRPVQNLIVPRSRYSLQTELWPACSFTRLKLAVACNRSRARSRMSKTYDSRLIASLILKDKVKGPSTSTLTAITEPICFANQDRGEKPAVKRFASPILCARIHQSIFVLFADWVRVKCAKTVFDTLIVDLRNFRHLKFARTFLTIACLIFAGLIGYADYLTGYERSLLLFYLLPIS